MKYDALHNRQFLETMFNPGEETVEGGPGGGRITQIVSEASMNVTKDTSSTKDLPKLPKLRELYHLSKVLFEYTPPSPLVPSPVRWTKCPQFCESAGIWDFGR